MWTTPLVGWWGKRSKNRLVEWIFQDHDLGKILLQIFLYFRHLSRWNMHGNLEACIDLLLNHLSPGARVEVPERD